MLSSQNSVTSVETHALGFRGEATAHLSHPQSGTLLASSVLCLVGVKVGFLLEVQRLHIHLIKEWLLHLV